MQMSQLMVWLSDNHEVANALAAIFSALTALVALFMSVIALQIQRHHNVLSVRPIPEVTVADYEDSLRIKLRNSGVGPMFLKGVRVMRDEEEKDSVVAWMPILPEGRMWTHFATDLASRTVPVDGAIPLLDLTKYEGERNFAACRDLVRDALRELTVEVDYSDAYQTRFPIYLKSLKWFGRNLKSD
jgi:hypothetical protein